MAVKSPEKRPATILRRLAPWLLVIVTLTMVVRVLSPRDERADLSYTDLLRELDRDNLVEAEILTANQQLLGELRCRYCPQRRWFRLHGCRARCRQRGLSPG